MIQDNEPFPQKYHEAISSLWMDKNIQRVLTRADEAAIPEKCVCIVCCLHFIELNLQMALAFNTSFQI